MDGVEVGGGDGGTDPADGEGGGRKFVGLLVCWLACWGGLVAGGVYDGGEEFDTSGSGLLGAGGEVVVSDDDEGSVAHDRVYFPAQESADERVGVKIVAVEDGVVVVHHHGDAGEGVFTGREPGQGFFFEPDQVEFLGGEEGAEAGEVGTDEEGQALTFPRIQVLHVLIREQGAHSDFETVRLQKWQVLVKTNPAGRTEGAVTGEEEEVHGVEVSSR